MSTEDRRIGNYQIVSPLGQGGMATVFKAYHPRLDRYVALKMIHQSFLSDPQFVARFEREAQIIAQLEHPNIVPVFDFAEHQGQPYLVMKYISGISLADALEDGPLELRDLMSTLAQIAAALDYAHRQNILHRDIKPSNIMLDETATAYLTDFGLARTVEAGTSTLSRGLLLGTPAYMSPEQGEGLLELDARSDLYSLGVVIYELVVGRVPFDTGTTFTILRDHLTAPLPLPSSLNPEIPPAVDSVLLRALAKDPSSRYESAAEMVGALREAFVGSQIRRLNAGGRHTISQSLRDSRIEADTPETSSPMLQRTPFEIAAQPPAQPPVKDSAPVPKPASEKISLPVALGTLALIALAAVAVAALVLNLQNRAGVASAADTLPTVMQVAPTEPVASPAPLDAPTKFVPSAIPNTPIPTPTVAPTFTLMPTNPPPSPPTRPLADRRPRLFPRDDRP